MNYGHWSYEALSKNEYKLSSVGFHIYWSILLHRMLPIQENGDLMSFLQLKCLRWKKLVNYSKCPSNGSWMLNVCTFSSFFSRFTVKLLGRAIQAGQQQLHNILLVRLTTRYQQEGNKYERLLTKFIAQDHRRRSELAMLWLAELYAQYQGFSICLKISSDDEKTLKQARLALYNRVLCGMLEHFHQNGLHQEVSVFFLYFNSNPSVFRIFYKVILDSPHITTESLQWLKLACIDPVRFPPYYLDFCFRHMAATE